MRKQLRTTPWLATAAALALAIPFASTASEPNAPAAPADTVAAPAPDAHSPSSGGGMDAVKAGKNPKTGQLEPVSSADDAYLTTKSRAALGSFPYHSPKKLRNGTETFFAAPHGMGIAVAKVGPDGKLVWDCDKSVEGALAKVDARQQPTAPVQEEK